MNTNLAPLQSLPFELGEPSSFGGLALVPLFPTADRQLEYIGLDEAVATGLAVTKIDESGSVPTLFVSNPLDVTVLLYEGEELVGAKQNRILDRSILVQAESKTAVPVSCVEVGRWSYRSKRFAPAPRTAYPDLRRAKRQGGDQGTVWHNVAAKSMRLNVKSPTGASEAMYDSRGTSLDQYVAQLPRRDGQCGSIVCVAGRVVCLDFVGRSDVYAASTRSSCAGTRSTRSSSPSMLPCRRSTSRACSVGSPGLHEAKRRSSASAKSGVSSRLVSSARSLSSEMSSSR